MIDLYTDHSVKIDAKGRFKLPASIVRKIKEVGVSFVMRPGGEEGGFKFVEIWPKRNFDKVASKMVSLPGNQRNRMMRARFFKDIVELSLDSNDRLLVKGGLSDYAGLKDELILSGDGSMMRLWNKVDYDRYVGQVSDDDYNDFVMDATGGIDFNN